MNGPLLLCYRCNHTGSPKLVWKPYRRTNGGTEWHLGAYCRHCGRWIKWVPQVPEWLAIAPPKPEEERVICGTLFDVT